MIRDAAADDFPSILDLNAESVQFLSALSGERLLELHAHAAYHRVLEAEGGVRAFLLAFREAAPYNSPNYAWFSCRYRAFLYIDRIVVHASCRGRGYGAMLYDDIIAFATRANISPLTCEFDLEPPNPGSTAFHRRFGFREVGTQWVQYGGGKKVSLQALDIGPRSIGRVT